MQTTRRALIGLLSLLFVPTSVFAQTETEGNLALVNARAKTVNKELRALGEKFGVEFNIATEGKLAHIKTRQVFYRMKRTARKTSALAQKQGLEPARLPERPRGELPISYLEDISTIILEKVRAINEQARVPKQQDVGSLAGEGPPDVFATWAETIGLLDETMAYLEGRPGSRTEEVSAPATPTPGPKGKRRR
ncbi:MAG: hypothetical protein R3C68_10370 [Myxococcota bacterium]